MGPPKEAGGSDCETPLLADDDAATDKKDATEESAQEEPVYLRGVISIFLFPALGGLLYGYDIGATSMVLVDLVKARASGVVWYHAVADSPFLQGLIASTSTWGAAVGSLCCLRLEAELGRRRELLVAGTLYFIGLTLEWLSGVSSWSGELGISVLLIGRVLYGIAIGFAMHGAPAYIAEMAPPSYRGLLVSLKEAFIVLGMLLGYTSGMIFNYSVGGWRYTYAVALPIAVAMSIGIYLLPPSARWLCLRGRLDDAKASLAFVLPPRSAKAAYADIMKVANARTGSTAGAAATGVEAPAPAGGAAVPVEKPSGGFEIHWERLREPACARALRIGIGLVALQQFTGQPSVLYYVDTLFTEVLR